MPGKPKSIRYKFMGAHRNCIGEVRKKKMIGYLFIVIQVEGKMENIAYCVEIVTNKTYFIEDAVHISFKFNKFLKPTYTDWIALYKCSSKRNLEEFVAVETDLTICSPTKHGLNPVTFHTNQLKNVKCNVEYEFLYGNKFNEICGASCPVRFIHKNDCIYCYPNGSANNPCNDCISQELIDSLLARISFVDSQLIDCKLQSNEIMSMNKRLITRMNECEVVVQKNNQFLDDLFFSIEPVTKDGYRWMQQCSDIDLKMNLISSQERELQDLSNQNAGLTKALENINNKDQKKEYNQRLSNSDELVDSMVEFVESGVVPEPLSATFVYIDSDEEL